MFENGPLALKKKMKMLKNFDDNNVDQRQRNQLGSNELKMKHMGLKAFVPSTKPKRSYCLKNAFNEIEKRRGDAKKNVFPIPRPN